VSKFRSCALFREIYKNRLAKGGFFCYNKKSGIRFAADFESKKGGTA
jgi:hypothetical protein